MSTVIDNHSPRLIEQSRTTAYMELTKLRISVMVLITFMVAGVIAAAAVGNAVNWTVLVCAMIGMLAISASGNAMNMYLERYTDFLMDRTRQRPLPAQRLTANEVALFVAISFGIGVAFLFTTVNWQTGVCGVATWILYVAIYTPMKTKTWLNTEVGAVAGALPILMGCLATTQTVPLVGWGFFLVLLFWQFPHFMAIAWMYRDDYEKGGMKMLTVVDPTGVRAGRKSIVMAVVTTLASLIPALTFSTSAHATVFSILSILLGAWYLKASIHFARELDLASAKRLLRVSIIYLPGYMLILTIASLT